MPAVGYALLMPAVGYALLASFHQDHPSVHVHSGFWLELCSLPGVAVLRVRQSRPASTVHTVFCSVVPWFVKGLRCSLAVVMALHEPLAIFMALHESLAMALHGFPASLSTCWPTCSLSHAPSRAARVEGVDFRLVVNSAMPCLWPLLCVAGNTSLLEPQPRRSAHFAFRRALLCSVSPRSSMVVLPPLPALCRRSSHVAALHESALSICVWGDHGSLPWSGFPLLRPPGCSPAEAQSLRLFAAVAAAAVCLVVRGHSSTQTCSN